MILRDPGCHKPRRSTHGDQRTMTMATRPERPRKSRRRLPAAMLVLTTGILFSTAGGEQKTAITPGENAPESTDVENPSDSASPDPTCPQREPPRKTPPPQPLSGSVPTPNTKDALTSAVASNGRSRGHDRGARPPGKSEALEEHLGHRVSLRPGIQVPSSSLAFAITSHTDLPSDSFE